MLQIAQALRDVINKYITIYGTPDLVNDKLTNMEQATVKVIKDFLEKLLMSTKACESKESTLNLCLPVTNYILTLFKKHKNLHKDDPMFVLMFNSGQAKIDKYYKLSDRTPTYVVAMVLHLSCKQKWIKKHQKSDQISLVKVIIKVFQETRYKDQVIIVLTLLTTPPTKALNDFLVQLNGNDKDNLLGDKYTKYCAQPQVPSVQQGYKWWLEPTQQKNFPNLSKMALNILLI